MRLLSSLISIKAKRIKETTLPENITPCELINALDFIVEPAGVSEQLIHILQKTDLERFLIIKVREWIA